MVGGHRAKTTPDMGSFFFNTETSAHREYPYCLVVAVEQRSSEAYDQHDSHHVLVEVSTACRAVRSVVMARVQQYCHHTVVAAVFSSLLMIDTDS